MTPADKPRTAAGYSPDAVTAVREACLWLATVLGDLMGDSLVIAGGLVPGLLVDQENLPEGADRHPGTLGLDVALQLGVLEAEQYREISKRLREAGCAVGTNKEGNRTLQRWKIAGVDGKEVLLEFLIAPSEEGEPPGTVKHIEDDFGAFVTRGLELAFKDRERCHLRGKTILGEEATRDIAVCGPGAFVVLKALAFRNRGSRKDAFDLYYVIRNYGRGAADVAARLKPLLDDPAANDAIGTLRTDFSSPDAVGVTRAAEFVAGRRDDGLRQDIFGDVSELLTACNGPASKIRQ